MAITDALQPPQICPACNRDFVIPRDWWEEESQRTDGWTVDLWCPICDWNEVKEIDEDILDDYDEFLEKGVNQIKKDLRKLTKANMGEYIELFTKALRADAIWPTDF